MSLGLSEGETLALLGRNGSGRSTTVKTIMGLVDGEGSIRWREAEVLGRKPFEIAHAGVGYVPENRDIFPTLTVHQNLLLGAHAMGFGAGLTSGQAMASKRLSELCELAADEVPVCCVNIGTVSKRKPGTRVRPLPSSFVSELGGGQAAGRVQ